MYFTSGSDRAFEQLMQGKPGFDHYDSGEAVTPEDCGTCRFYRPHWKYQFCVYAECPYQPGKLTAYDAVTFRVKGVENMAVFRVERNKGYLTNIAYGPASAYGIATIQHIRRAIHVFRFFMGTGIMLRYLSVVPTLGFEITRRCGNEQLTENGKISIIT